MRDLSGLGNSNAVLGVSLDNITTRQLDHSKALSFACLVLSLEGLEDLSLS